MKITVSSEFIEETPEALAEVRTRLLAGLEAAAAELEYTAKAETPVKSGALQGTVHTKLNEKVGALYLVAGGKGAPHAHLVEYGTRFAAANPFMKRAIGKEKGYILEVIRRRLETG